MAVDPKDITQPDINVYVSQLCEELRALKNRINLMEGREVRAPEGEVLSELPVASARALKTLSFDALGNVAADAPIAGDYSAYAVELTNRLKRDGTQAMLAELPLAGNAVTALGAVPKQQFDAGLLLVCPPGSIMPMARLTAPAGWLLIDGKTIGGATSGATSRANADTVNLFAELWAFPDVAIPIYDSAGAASVRGASAAADFAAGKRLPLFTPDGGAFIRMWAPGQTVDAGRVVGTPQGDAIRNIYGSFHAVRTSWHQDGAFYDTGGRINGSDTGGSPTPVVGFSAANVVPTAAENRPYSLAVPHYMKL